MTDGARKALAAAQARRLGLVPFAGIALVFLISVPAYAQTARVIRNVNLRQDPSTAEAPLVLLTPPRELALVEPGTTNSYVHVRLPTGEVGWVWSRNVVVSAPGPSGMSSTASAIPTAAIYDDIQTSWPRPAPNHTTFHFGADTCGPSGEGGDDATNLRKNRTDEPAAYFPVTFHAVADLPYPKAPRSRAQWTKAELSQVAGVEGAPISIVGYLVDALNVEKAETTNCGETQPQEVDWHMYLTEDFVADDGKKHKGEAVVVETTPRVRENHPGWRNDVLGKWVNADKPVRISGWLLLDPEHAADIAKGYRTTIWEIHPITKIEVSEAANPAAGDWKSLEDEH